MSFHQIIRFGDFVDRLNLIGGRHDRDRTIVGLTTTYAISAYRHQRGEIMRGALDTTLRDKVCR